MEKDTASIDPVTVIDDTSIKPFRVDFQQEAIDDLRRRIEMTRWASKELVPDASQGVQEEMLQELARYWATEYDLGRVAERLNALPQFTTEIDGLRIHFIHVKSKHEDALPLIMTHGWPGSVIEMLETIGPLTDPTAHGGDASDAFDLVLPSLPGFGFSRPAHRARLGSRPNGPRVGGPHEPARVHAATSPRVATSGPTSPIRWPDRHPTGSSAST